MAKLIFQASGKVDELNKQLDVLEQMDKVVEAKQKKAGFGCLGVGIVFALTVLLVFATGGQQAWAFVLLGVALLGLIAMIVVYSRLASQNLEDRRIDVAKKLFGILGKDVPPKAKCELTVSFQNYSKHGELVSKDGGMFSSIVNKVYVDDWFQGKGALYDGNRFAIAIKQTVKRKEKRKRKRTKVTEKLSEDLALTLLLDANSYPKFADAQTCVDPSGAPAGMAIKSVSQTDNRLKVVATTGTQMSADKLIDGDRLLALFMYVYQGLAACRSQPA